MVHAALAAAEKKDPRKVSAHDVLRSHSRRHHREYISIVLFEILEAMTTRQNTAIALSKQLSGYAHDQNVLNIENAAIHFARVPDGATPVTIEQINELNEELAAMREDIQNALVTKRQNSQVTMTLASTTVNMLQQNAAMGSDWIHKVADMFQVIAEMTENS